MERRGKKAGIKGVEEKIGKGRMEKAGETEKKKRGKSIRSKGEVLEAFSLRLLRVSRYGTTGTAY